MKKLNTNNSWKMDQKGGAFIVEDSGYGFGHGGTKGQKQHIFFMKKSRIGFFKSAEDWHFDLLEFFR